MNDDSILQFIRDFGGLTRLQQRIFLHFLETNTPIVSMHDKEKIAEAAARLRCNPRSIQRALDACNKSSRLANVVRYVKITRKKYEEMVKAEEEQAIRQYTAMGEMDDEG